MARTRPALDPRSLPTRSALAVALAVALAACGGGPPAQLDSADHVKEFAGSSAPAVYFSALSLLSTSTPGAMPDPTCPSITTNGDTRTYHGGCTDSHGVAWLGTATVVGAMATRAQSATFDGFGRTAMANCGGMQFPSTQTTHGTFTASLDAATQRVDFHFDLTYEFDRPTAGACATSQHGTGSISYTGSYVPSGPDRNMDGTPDGTTWNGSGRIGDSIRGMADARTQDEVLDSHTCMTEALSGTTTLTAGSNTAVITYDGATDCSMMSTVTWTLNGAAQGTLTGVQCTAAHAPARQGTRALAVLSAAVALLVASARRRRRRPA